MFQALKRLVLRIRLARHAHHHAHHAHGLRRHGKWRRLAVASAACGACVGSVALAHPGGHGGPEGPEGPGQWGGPGGPMAEEAGAWLDGLLAEIGATDAQKATAHAAQKEVFAAMRQTHEGGRGDMEAALKLFAADTVDEPALAALRQKFQGRHQAVEQAILGGVLKIHDQLDAKQLHKLVAALKDLRPEERGGWHKAIGKRMMEGRLEQLLTRIAATDAQKATIRATKDKLVAAFEGQHATRTALFDEALGLLAQPKIDRGALDRLVAKHDAARTAMGDTMLQGAREIHAALTPQQRAQVVKTIEERGHRWGGHHGR